MPYKGWRRLRKLIGHCILIYTRCTPLKRGKSRLGRYGLKALHETSLTVPTIHGSKFHLSFPKDSGASNIYLTGTHEGATTQFIGRILKRDNVVFDIGANIGWYTVLMGKIVIQGQVHSFEPVPSIFEKLQINCSLNKLGKNVNLNQLALGEEEGFVEVYTFRGLPDGHSSISKLGRSDYSISKATMIRLDAYLKENKVRKVDVIKMDAEGSEMAILKGVTGVFKLCPKPIWILELNEETSAAFGYEPSDLLRFLESQADYRFYRMKKSGPKLSHMVSLENFEDGDNVICVPTDRVKELRIVNEIVRKGLTSGY